MDLLPPTTYQSPATQARGGALNTIKEESEHGMSSDSDGSGSDGTIIGRPAGWNPKMFVAAPRRSSKLSSYITPSSPISSVEASPISDDAEGLVRQSRSSYTPSEVGTLFSEESCPSLASDPTTFATDSIRNRLASSTKSGRNRYPALLIPRGSWHSEHNLVKEISLGMSPNAKVVLSPEILSSLSRPLPAENATPSLGTSSLASRSPCVGALSVPGTPDSRQLELAEGETWGTPADLTSTPLEIAVDEDHSVILSPEEAHGSHSALQPSAGQYQTLPSAREREWGDMVIKFPAVPGASRQRDENPLQALKADRGIPQRTPSAAGTESGVLLSNDALQTLQSLTKEVGPDQLSDCSRSAGNEEMRERNEGGINHRRSLDGLTPATEASLAKLSEYSFTQLSIPSPGGFFSSLQPGSRNTWCLNRSVNNSVPTSAVAENFYADWPRRDEVKETTLEIDDTNATDGPPTARQAQFNVDASTATRATFDVSKTINGYDRRASISTSSEDEDMYGAAPNEPNFTAPAEAEYEEAYQEELKQVAEQNMDRTSSWLAAQTSYMSVLRETNPVNKPEDYAPSPHPINEDDESRPRSGSVDSNIRKTVRFLEAAKTSPIALDDGGKSVSASPDSERGESNPVFHEAFEHLLKNRGRRDAFLASGPRLEAVRASRVATPAKYVDSLVGRVAVEAMARPKYSGPFNQNPRATGIFERTEASLTYETAEREQRALASIQASTWQTEALRATYNGRLFASRFAHERLKAKATTPLSDAACVGNKRIRILDLGGESNASWGWAAACEYQNVKVYTVITKEQAASQRPAGEAKPEGPPNHRTVSVPYVWQLPFKNNHFDVISARSLHMLLKANPVPGAPEIDEWSMTLKECMRILKPGGYIDFIVMDSSVARAGPRGEAMSVEFGFDLHRRGYSRDPARTWLRRLNKEGFTNTKRAWMFWPLGRKSDTTETEQGARAFLPAPRPVSEVSTISKIVKQYLDVEAVQGPVGSTQDAADITGLLGTRMFEEWIVKIRQEAGRESARLLEGIDDMLEEGKSNGGGFRVLVGWARKPRSTNKEKKAQEKPKELSPVKEEIVIAFDSDAEIDMAASIPARPHVGEIPMMIVG